MPLPWSVSFAVGDRAGCVRPTEYPRRPEGLTIARNSNRVCRVGLQFDGIRARSFGSFNDADRLIEILVMVGGDFRDAIRGKPFLTYFCRH